MKPWKKVASFLSDDGELALLQRDGRFLLKIGNQVLMNSHLSLTEQALARLALAHIPKEKKSRVLVSGLGMGITLRAALDELGSGAKVEVAELNPVMVTWCKGVLASCNKAALADSRVSVTTGDVMALVRQRVSEGVGFEGVLLDMYEGTFGANSTDEHPIFGRGALETIRKVLVPGGCLGVWTEAVDDGFGHRARGCGFEVDVHLPGRGGPRHAIYVMKKV